MQTIKTNLGCRSIATEVSPNIFKLLLKAELNLFSILSTQHETNTTNCLRILFRTGQLEIGRG